MCVCVVCIYRIIFLQITNNTLIRVVLITFSRSTLFDVGSLFNGMSTLMCYLMPKLSL